MSTMNADNEYVQRNMLVLGNINGCQPCSKVLSSSFLLEWETDASLSFFFWSLALALGDGKKR